MGRYSKLHNGIFREAFAKIGRPAARLARNRQPVRVQWPRMPRRLLPFASASAACASCFAKAMLPTNASRIAASALYSAAVSFSSARCAESTARRVSSRALANSPPYAAVSDSMASISSSYPGFPISASGLALHPRGIVLKEIYNVKNSMDERHVEIVGLRLLRRGFRLIQTVEKPGMRKPDSRRRVALPELSFSASCAAARAFS